jgi:diaminopimelate decarboxylase
MRLNRDCIKNIASQYGESFYLLDSKLFEKNYKELLSAFREVYSNSHIAYSYKTNYIPKLCKIIDRLGGYAEIVSDMEHDIAKEIGVKPEKIIFNGPYKNPTAVKEVLLGGGIVNIDSASEIPIIAEIAKDNPDKKINIGIRCNFDIKDNVVSRFGFDINSAEFVQVIALSQMYSNINLTGFHCHFASRRLETWINRAKGMVDLVKNYFEQVPESIDLGGGLFGKMGESLKVQFDSYIPDYTEYAKAAAGIINSSFTGHRKPILFIEPGSALVADVMKFAAKVVSIKTVRKKAIATLLGSIYNINPTLNNKNLPITVYSMGGNQTEFRNLDFGGYTCVESDYLYRGYNGKLTVGDYVVFDNVGSYSIVLKPPFILPNFAIVDYDDETGKVELIKKRETFNDLFCTYVF